MAGMGNFYQKWGGGIQEWGQGGRGWFYNWRDGNI